MAGHPWPALMGRAATCLHDSFRVRLAITALCASTFHSSSSFPLGRKLSQQPNKNLGIQEIVWICLPKRIDWAGRDEHSFDGFTCFCAALDFGVCNVRFL